MSKVVCIYALSPALSRLNKHKWFYNLAGVPWPHICNFLTELWGVDYLLSLLCNSIQLKQRGESVGFAYINTELKIKLWALIRNLCLGFILLLPARPFSFPASLSGTQFSVAAGQLQLRSWIFIIFSTHDNIMLLPREVLKMCLKIIMTWCWDNQKGGHTTRLSLITFL